jgi:hypothetical protein
MEQAFPTPDKVAEMVATVNEAKKVQLPGGWKNGTLFTKPVHLFNFFQAN